MASHGGTRRQSSGLSLAIFSGVCVARFERGDSVRPSTVEAIQRALEKAGVIFIDAKDGGPGARLGS
jgi:hypothetical protein